MFARWAVLVLATGVLLGGCKHEGNHAMQVSLSAIQGMVKQSALMAVQAACAPQDTRHDMIQASVTLLRRAMGGPEMEKVHKMMGLMPDTGSSSSGSGDKKYSKEMKLHVAIHNAGEDVFDFLDALNGSDAPTCQQVQSVELAAAAAVMREHHSPELDRVEKQLNDKGARLAHEKVPDVVHRLAADLAQI